MTITSTAADTLAARAAITTFIEPGDTVAGALIDALGPIAAFETLTSSGDRREALVDTGIGAAEARAALNRWTPRIHLKAIEENLAAAEREGITIVDPNTLPALADLGAARPVALYVRGDATALAASTPVTVTGARASSSYGEHTTAEIISGLTRQDGITILSGGAYGIDGTAHRSALRVGIPTIAALAGGIDRPYPTGHSDLFANIAHNGAVISESPFGAAPTKWRFLARGRILAALSRAVVVVEAGARSGTLAVASQAIELGRAVGAVPGPVTSSCSVGCHLLIRELNATLITDSSDVSALLAS